MNRYFVCMLLSGQFMCALEEKKHVHNHRIILPDTQGKKVIINCNINQHVNVDNHSTQHNTNTSSSTAKPVSMQNTHTPTVQATTSGAPVFSALKSLAGPLSFITACIGYLCYIIRTKCSLVAITKACAKKAFWSLWNRRTQEMGLDPYDMDDTDLLMHLLETYKTDHYATAISRFLQDVDDETELLQAYIEKASAAHTSYMSFLFHDLSQEITLAQERVATLAELKRTVLSWLSKKNIPI